VDEETENKTTTKIRSSLKTSAKGTNPTASTAAVASAIEKPSATLSSKLRQRSSATHHRQVPENSLRNFRSGKRIELPASPWKPDSKDSDCKMSGLANSDGGNAANLGHVLGQHGPGHGQGLPMFSRDAAEAEAQAAMIMNQRYQRALVEENQLAAARSMGLHGQGGNANPLLLQEEMRRREQALLERGLAARHHGAGFGAAGNGGGLDANSALELEMLAQREEELLRIRESHSRFADVERGGHEGIHAMNANEFHMAAAARRQLHPQESDAFRADAIERIIALQEQRRRELEFMERQAAAAAGQRAQLNSDFNLNFNRGNNQNNDAAAAARGIQPNAFQSHQALLEQQELLEREREQQLMAEFYGRASANQADRELNLQEELALREEILKRRMIDQETLAMQRELANSQAFMDQIRRNGGAHAAGGNLHNAGGFHGMNPNNIEAAFAEANPQQRLELMRLLQWQQMSDEDLIQREAEIRNGAAAAAMARKGPGNNASQSQHFGPNAMGADFAALTAAEKRLLMEQRLLQSQAQQFEYQNGRLSAQGSVSASNGGLHGRKSSTPTGHPKHDNANRTSLPQDQQNLQQAQAHVQKQMQMLQMQQHQHQQQQQQQQQHRSPSSNGEQPPARSDAGTPRQQAAPLRYFNNGIEVDIHGKPIAVSTNGSSGNHATKFIPHKQQKLPQQQQRLQANNTQSSAESHEISRFLNVVITLVPELTDTVQDLFSFDSQQQQQQPHSLIGIVDATLVELKSLQERCSQTPHKDLPQSRDLVTRISHCIAAVEPYKADLNAAKGGASSLNLVKPSVDIENCHPLRPNVPHGLGQKNLNAGSPSVGNKDAETRSRPSTGNVIVNDNVKPNKSITNNAITSHDFKLSANNTNDNMGTKSKSCSNDSKSNTSQTMKTKLFPKTSSIKEQHGRGKKRKKDTKMKNASGLPNSKEKQKFQVDDSQTMKASKRSSSKPSSKSFMESNPPSLSHETSKAPSKEKASVDTQSSKKSKPPKKGKWSMDFNLDSHSTTPSTTGSKKKFSTTSSSSSQPSSPAKRPRSHSTGTAINSRARNDIKQESDHKTSLGPLNLDLSLSAHLLNQASPHLREVPNDMSSTASSSLGGVSSGASSTNASESLLSSSSNKVPAPAPMALPMPPPKSSRPMKKRRITESPITDEPAIPQSQAVVEHGPHGALLGQLFGTNVESGTLNKSNDNGSFGDPTSNKKAQIDSLANEEKKNDRNNFDKRPKTADDDDGHLNAANVLLGLMGK